MEINNKIRNIAIIAHVDHGKTTLVDQMMKYCNLFRTGEEVQDCFLDSNDQERERGITILSKNISLTYKNVKINLIDTPGHADFSGEVERVLRLADGCILLVDAHDGVMPQTRFVLKKALLAGLKPVVVMNKMDRADARPQEALETVHDLFLELDVDDDVLDFPTLYASGRSGWASYEIDKQGSNLAPVMDTILEKVPGPQVHQGPLQMQVTSFEHSDFVGRIGVGRIYRGVLSLTTPVCLIKNAGGMQKVKVKTIYEFDGLGKKEVTSLSAGDLCAIVGVEGVEIGDTIADAENPEALPAISLEEPTISMLFSVNDSPGFGSDGKFVTSRHLRAALEKAKERDAAIRIEATDSEGTFKVYGRGVLHLSVLVENLRRTSHELLVGQPQVVYKEIDGAVHEPLEELIVEVHNDYAGKVIEEVAKRKGELQNIEYTADGQNQMFTVPSRGLIGLRTHLLNSCSGNIVMNHRFLKYVPKKGAISQRLQGVILSKEKGDVVGYALGNLQDRGNFFVSPGVSTYQGQIVGAHCKAGDIEVNVQKEKKLSNMRSSGSDKALKIAPATKMSLEESIEFIEHDEWVEVTPVTYRMRKKILDPNLRKRVANQAA